MTTVHIAAPGPSLTYDWLEPEHVVICINLALLKAPRANYWCCIDKPRKLHEMCFERALELKPVLLTKWKRVELYRKQLPGVDIRNVHEGIGNGWVYRLNMHGTSWSIFAAIAYAAEKLKADTIHFHGVDLKGVGYFDGLNPQGTVEKNWKGRWASKELAPMHELWLRAPENGVTLLGLPDVVKQAPPNWGGKVHGGRKANRQ